MIQASSTFSFKWFVKKSLLGLTIILSMTLIIVLFKIFFSQSFAPKSQGIAGLLSQRNVDVLFIGSSHSRQGYNISIIEKICDCNVYSIAYSGLDPHLMFQVLNYIKKYTTINIKKVVFEAYSQKVSAEVSFSDSRIYTDAPYELKKAIVLSLLKNMKSFNLKKAFQLILRENNESYLTSIVSNLILNRYSYKGGYKNKTTDILTKEGYQNAVKLARKHSVGIINNIQLDAIKNVMNLFKKEELIFINVPMPYPVTSFSVVTNNRDVFKNVVRKEGFRYIQPWKKSAKSKNHLNFTDWNHLSNYGRNEYSKDVGLILKGLL